MNIKHLTLGLTLLFTFLTVDAYRLESVLIDSIMPSSTIYQDNSGVTVSYKFPGAVVVQDDLYNDCVRLDIPGCGHNHNLNEPMWPIHSDTFELPYGCEPKVSVIYQNWLSLDLTLGPTRPLQYDMPNENLISVNENHISANEPYDYIGVNPQQPAYLSNIQIYRDRRIAYVNVIPVKSVNIKKIMVCDSLTYRIDFISADQKFKKEGDPGLHDIDNEYMESLFTSTLPNPNQERTISQIESIWKLAPYYIILSIPEFKSEITKFIKWKRCMGFNTYAFYQDKWDSNSIKETIQKIYASEKSLQYVLLVGDASALPPVKHPKANGNCAYFSDFTYGCMDGDDDLEQDIIIGRLSVSDISETSTVIDKIIKYERNPTVKEYFYKNALHAAFFEDISKQDGYEDTRFTRTSEDIRNGLSDNHFSIKRAYFAQINTNPTNWNNKKFGYGEKIPSDLLKPVFKWDGNTSDIIDAINSGTFYIFHRGHGSYSGWSSPTFRINNLSNLTNGSRLPICFSINCQSGAFGKTEVTINPYDDIYKFIDQSFAEALIRKQNGGAIGIIAPSEMSFSGPNDALSMELFHAIWPDSKILTDFPSYNSTGPNQIGRPIANKPTYALGKILQKGIIGVYSKYANISPYTKEIYHCFGDPSLQIYTSVPQDIYIFGNGSPFSIRTNCNVQMAVILKSGKVYISSGNEFDYSQFANTIDKFMLSAHNRIPVSRDMNNPLSIEKKYGINSLIIQDNYINVKYEVKQNNKSIVRIIPINAINGKYRDYSSDDNNISISTASFEKGTYILELIEDETIIDSRKIMI